MVGEAASEGKPSLFTADAVHSESRERKLWAAGDLGSPLRGEDVDSRCRPAQHCPSWSTAIVAGWLTALSERLRRRSPKSALHRSIWEGPWWGPRVEVPVTRRLRGPVPRWSLLAAAAAMVLALTLPMTKYGPAFQMVVAVKYGGWALLLGVSALASAATCVAAAVYAARGSSVLQLPSVRWWYSIVALVNLGETILWRRMGIIFAGPLGRRPTTHRGQSGLSSAGQVPGRGARRCRRRASSSSSTRVSIG